MTSSVALHHESDGPADAPVVVLLHAIGASMRMWVPQRPALAREHRVVSLDLRGHGASPVPDGPYAIADLGNDVLGLFDDLGIERASVCGLSLGGMVGLWMAAQAPERVDRLIAACVVAVPASPIAWRDRAQAVRSGGSASIADLVVDRWGYTHRAPEIGRLVQDMLAATPAAGYAGCCDAIAAMDLRPDLERIQAPTLVLAGRDDPAAPPAVATEIATRIPYARVEVIEGAAHLANVEAPGATTDAILQHLRR